MKLSGLLEKLEYTIMQGSADTEISGIVNDSRKAEKGSLFFCIKGAVTDGHKYAADVAAKGASALIVEDDVEVPADVTVVKVKDARYAMAIASSAWFGYPSTKLKVIGITGTKGKTTTTYMIKSILESAGHKVGLIGTIESIIGETHIPSEHTTPESMELQELFARMVEEGCEICVMEVSSQGLKLDRTAGVDFELGIFTNISPDHIGPAEHADFDEYLECKSRLFRQCRKGLLNADDEHTKDIIRTATCECETYGMGEEADFRAVNAKMIRDGGRLGVHYTLQGKLNFDVEINVPGRFSVYNSLCAASVCSHFGVNEENIRSALFNAHVKGRIEPVKVSDDFTLMIDYAHNAMALESLLTTLREYNPGRLVCMFGCGGNRSKLRRFEMGEVSGKMADLTVITSDNPRFEKPDDIIADIVTGISKTDGKYVTIPDRREAIAWVIHNGQPGDIIVLAGKGHEDYQEIEGKKYPMDERVIIQEILRSDHLTK